MPDFIYWTAPYDYTTVPGGGASGAIRRAPLSGAGPVETLYDATDGVNIAAGLAIDPAGERIYWANYGDSTIRRAPLDGSGTPDPLYDGADGVMDPWGVAIDSAGGRIYWTQGEWATNAGGSIRRAPLAGGTPDPLPLYGPAHGVSGPVGVAIDPAAGRIYWANSTDSTIRRAPLAGGTPDPPLYGSTHGVSGPACVAIDPAAGRIYWTSAVQNTIRGAPVTPGGSVDTLYDSAQVRFPGMLAIDPTPAGEVFERLEVAGGGNLERLPFGGWIRDLYSRFFPPASSPPGRLYWGNGGPSTSTSPLAASVRGAPLAGSGSVDRLYGPTEGPMAVALLRAPVGTAPPMVSWSLILDVYTGWQFGGGIGSPPDQQLTCSRGGWAADLPGAFLYRAPQSFAYQWRRDGTDIGGANSSRYVPNAPGNYTCRVTASNAAGSASQTSATFTVS